MIDLTDTEIRKAVNPPPANEVAIAEAQWSARLVEWNRSESP